MKACKKFDFVSFRVLSVPYTEHPHLTDPQPTNKDNKAEQIKAKNTEDIVMYTSRCKKRTTKNKIQHI